MKLIKINNTLVNLENVTEIYKRTYNDDICELVIYFVSGTCTEFRGSDIEIQNVIDSLYRTSGNHVFEIKSLS